MQWWSYIKIRTQRIPISAIGSKTGSPDTNGRNRSRSLLKTKCRGLPPESFCTEFSGAGTPITKRVALKGVRHDDGARQFERSALGRRHGKDGGLGFGGSRRGRICDVHRGED